MCVLGCGGWGGSGGVYAFYRFLDNSAAVPIVCALYMVLVITTLKEEEEVIINYE